MPDTSKLIEAIQGFMPGDHSRGDAINNGGEAGDNNAGSGNGGGVSVMHQTLEDVVAGHD